MDDHHDLLAGLDAVAVRGQLHADLLQLLALLLRAVQHRRAGRAPPLLHRETNTVSEGEAGRQDGPSVRYSTGERGRLLLHRETNTVSEGEAGREDGLSVRYSTSERGGLRFYTEKQTQ